MRLKPFRQFIDFFARRSRNFKVMISAGAFNRLFMGLAMGYESLYIRALGANPVELGSVRGVGLVSSGMMSFPVGWLSDRYSLKRMMLLGAGLMVVAPLVYALAWDWRLVIVAVVLFTVAMRTSWSISSIVIVNSLEDKDRAVGMGMSSTVSAFIGILAPMAAAFIVTYFGGINVHGIRPLYYIWFVGACFVVVLLAARLEEGGVRGLIGRPNIIKDYGEVLGSYPVMKRFLLMSCLSSFMMEMTMPFRAVYAQEIKGADAFILGGMGTAMSIVSTLVSIAIGVLADRIGRKKVLFLTRPFRWAAALSLILVPSPEYLIVTGVFEGLWMATMMVIWPTFTNELVPQRLRGRWTGIRFTFMGLSGCVAPVVGGFIWEALDPSYLFIIPAVFDMCVVLPILMTIPDTIRTGGPKVIAHSTLSEESSP